MNKSQDGPNQQNKIIRESDAQACALARSLLTESRIAALGVIEPQSGYPLVSRVAVMMDTNGEPLVLASSLSAHSKALESDARASLLIGEAVGKGDPLTHPRITIIGRMEILSRQEPDHDQRRARWLVAHPKAKLYIDFADFAFYRMTVARANLNGGFGKAYILSREELGITS